MAVGCARIADTPLRTGAFFRVPSRRAGERGWHPHPGRVVQRLVAAALCAVVLAMALWSGDAQAQVIFRETFGSANAQLPTAVSAADGNWTSAACLNGMIQLGDSPSDDSTGSTHFVRHNTATCTYAGNERVWYNRVAIAVQPSTTYFYSYWIRLDHPTSPPTLTQVVRNASTGTAIATTSELNPALVAGTWVRRMVRFTPTATTTSVYLDIRNGNINSGGNDFSLDDVMLAFIPVTLTKTTNTLAGGPFGFTLTNVNQASGTVTTAAANTPTVVDGNTANATVIAFTVADFNAAVSITESPLPANWALAGATCTDASGTAVGSFDLATRRYTLPGAAVVVGAAFTCNFTNGRTDTDLSITKDDGSTIYTPGNDVTYTIVATNDGPAAVTGAQISDALPSGITNASWNCGAETGGGTCGAASGVGGINTTADLPAGASVTYTLTLTVPSTFSGDLTNTAIVSAPSGIAETDTANNMASDTDTQFPLPPANVANIACTSDPNLFNTAYDGAGGRLPSGADTYWQVAFTTSTTGNNNGVPPGGLTYGTAVVVTDPATVSAWGGQKYANAAWISRTANAFHADFMDAYYRYQLNLQPGVDPAVFRLGVNWFSDNRVYRIYVNGVDQGVVDSGNGWLGASSGTLNGPWQSGLNEIIVHVQSGPSASDIEGLTAQFTPQPLCAPATVTLNKTTELVAGGPFDFGLTNTSQATGTVSTTAADVPTQVDGDTTSPGTTEPFSVATFGSDVVITESSLPTGWTLSDAICTSGGVTVGSRSGGAYTIPGSLIDSSAESFVCTFTNTPGVDLGIDKTANPTAVTSGDTVTYTIVTNNAGPGPGDGAVITDPVVPGVDCSGGTLTCGAETGGAVCPASPTVADLQGAGITIPTFPVGGSLQFTLTCTVTASGEP
jgi:uncharacterized repeat protein (TIGR01451 family)